MRREQAPSLLLPVALSASLLFGSTEPDMVEPKGSTHHAEVVTGSEDSTYYYEPNTNMIEPVSYGSGSFDERLVAFTALSDPRINFARVHVSGVRDTATARDNAVQVASGLPVETSCYGNAPCATTTIRPALMRTLVAMVGDGNTIRVSEIAGASHAPGSSHYEGDAVDIDMVNGGIGPSNIATVLDYCARFGASELLNEGNHAHCGWGGADPV